MGNYSIKQLHKENFDLLIPLMMDCFGMNTDIEYFKWKFVNNPAGQVIGYFAQCNDTGEVAAYYGVIPEIYMIDGKKKTIFQSCDTMTHSKHRRKGLFKKLANFCYDQLRAEGKLFIIGFSGRMSTPGFLKFGWKHIFDMKYYFIPRLFILPFLGNIKGRKEYHIREITDYGMIENLILDSNQSERNHSLKTLEIFRWRVSNPRIDYKTRALWNGHEYQSYVTYYIENQKIFLFDFYYKNKSAFKALIKDLKKEVKADRFKGIVSYVKSKSEFSKALKGVGFISNNFSKGPLSEKGPFILLAENDDLMMYSHPDRWLISAFDHDSM